MRNWLPLAFRNCRRRPLRTCITATAVAIAIGSLYTVLAFQQSYRRSLARDLDQLGAHVLIVPKGCPYDAASLALHGANWPCPLKQSYLDEVRSVSGVAVAAPAFMTAFFEGSGEHTVYVGIETNMLLLKPAWRVEGRFPARGEALLGAEVARRSGWRAGDTMTAHGGTSQSLRVSGTLAPTRSAEDGFIFLPLADAQERFGHPGELTHVLVRLKDPNRLDGVVTALRGCNAGLDMNVVPLAHLFRTIQSVVNSTRWLLGCVTLSALLAAAAGVGASFLISVAERTREIGVMRAIGASRALVFTIVWTEALVICAAGAIAGILATLLLVPSLESWLRDRMTFVPTGALVAPSPGVLALCIAGAAVVATVGVIIPALRASQLPPAIAMKEHAQTA